MDAARRIAKTWLLFLMVSAVAFVATAVVVIAVVGSDDRPVTGVGSKSVAPSGSQGGTSVQWPPRSVAGLGVDDLLASAPPADRAVARQICNQSRYILASQPATDFFPDEDVAVVTEQMSHITDKNPASSPQGDWELPGTLRENVGVGFGPLQSQDEFGALTRCGRGRRMRSLRPVARGAASERQPLGAGSIRE